MLLQRGYRLRGHSAKGWIITGRSVILEQLDGLLVSRDLHIPVR
jgi:hypothetical protein